MILDDYLEELDAQESFFAMDSVHTDRPISRKIITGKESDSDEYIGDYPDVKKENKSKLIRK